MYHHGCERVSERTLRFSRIGKTYSRGKLPLSGGIGLAFLCPPPGPPKLISLCINGLTNLF